MLCWECILEGNADAWLDWLDVPLLTVYKVQFSSPIVQQVNPQTWLAPASPTVKKDRKLSMSLQIPIPTIVSPEKAQAVIEMLRLNLIYT